MKKIYQTPDTLLVFIETERFMAGSGVENGFDPENAEETYETSGNLSRRRRNTRNNWEDDEMDNEFDDYNY
ncbi:MAG: hypothetical protein IJV34_01800 [Prevotella sp.]|nr:hypothetical protein [Prevotella sp.]